MWAREVRRVEELEGQGQAAYSEGITDTVRVLQLFTQESVEGQNKLTSFWQGSRGVGRVEVEIS